MLRATGSIPRGGSLLAPLRYESAQGFSDLDAEDRGARLESAPIVTVRAGTVLATNAGQFVRVKAHVSNALQGQQEVTLALVDSGQEGTDLSAVAPKEEGVVEAQTAVPVEQVAQQQSGPLPGSLEALRAGLNIGSGVAAEDYQVAAAIPAAVQPTNEAAPYTPPPPQSYTPPPPQYVDPGGTYVPPPPQQQPDFDRAGEIISGIGGLAGEAASGAEQYWEQQI